MTPSLSNTLRLCQIPVDETGQKTKLSVMHGRPGNSCVFVSGTIGKARQAKRWMKRIAPMMGAVVI